MKQTLLRHIPKVDEFLYAPELFDIFQTYPRSVVIQAIRKVLEELRQQILAEQIETVSKPDLLKRIQHQVAESGTRHLKRVINGTGIIVHTNLGRSKLSSAAIEAVAEIASAYSNLEYDLQQGTRGGRYSHVDTLLCELLGCEGALVVNNNAAAVLLALSALGQGREAIVSRGELVEIGGSFRVPDVIQQGGCQLREVGTTNRTHLRDYAQAITEHTALILKVHTSNYRVVGFTKTVPLNELKKLAVQHNIPLLEDMGSGLLFNLSAFGLGDEPTVQESLAAGVDVITFSGDKLLGGPQAGIIVGKQKYIEIMKTHPLTRALRIDKMTLAALEATLQHYRDEEEAFREIETLRIIALTPEELYTKAEALQQRLHSAGIPANISPITSQVGGGALPTQELNGSAVTIELAGYSANQIKTRLRAAKPPIIGRIVKECYLLDVRTLEEADFPGIVASCRTMLENRSP